MIVLSVCVTSVECKDITEKEMLIEIVIAMLLNYLK